ncbi:MAG TPA: hypothetical protein VGV38_04145 [Pyrinomonadaceae bacterium]|nr:hypothetical protein [Pyrinomonadaceae bacterium]
MPDKGKLKLRLTDVYGKFLGEKVDVFLRHMQLNETLKASHTATSAFAVAGLRREPQGLYRVDIDPPSYLSVSQFVRVKSSGDTPLEVVFPVDAKKVKDVTFPAYKKLSEDARALLKNSDKVFSFEGRTEQTLYDALDDLRRAGLLNILAKTNATPLSNGRTVLSYVGELRELRGDRFFAVVSKELREETKHSIADGLFREVSGSLHSLPGSFSGFTPAGSFKTPDRYGNLQLTFFMRGDECVADIDIDDAAGIEHVFQVLRNALPGQSTHPYNIHQILVAHQKLDPGYRFVF